MNDFASRDFQKNEDIDYPRGLQVGVLDDKNLSLLVSFKRETNRVDYKSTFSASNKKTCQEFSKDVSAFSNVGGGYIVIGIEPKAREVIGINEKTQSDLDPTKISQTLSKFISPPINLHTYVGKFENNKGKSIGVGLIYIPEFRSRPHIINGNYSYRDGSKDKPSLHAGTIYVRRHSATKPIDTDSWEELLERYYEKAFKLRNIYWKEKESEELFDLERKVFFKKAFKELSK